MKKLYVFLNGGLGNQMFQYASARAIAEKLGAEVVMDIRSGFVRDYQYKRHYELGAFNFPVKIAKKYESLPIWLFRLENKLKEKTNSLVQQRLYGTFLVENKKCYLHEVENFKFRKSAWMVGYWQSPLYFTSYAHLIKAELMPPLPIDKRILTLGYKMREKESVALGIRLYEESNDPSEHTIKGKIKTKGEINTAIRDILNQVSNANFFVFCTHHSPFLKELELPNNTTFLTKDDGYNDTLESLWLLTQSRHHIITNSTYYWWGAWLSEVNYINVTQHIFAADNFKNTDGICDSWKKY